MSSCCCESGIDLCGVIALESLRDPTPGRGRILLLTNSGRRIVILYIVRHATAVPHGTAGISEDARPLTEKGAKKMREVASGLRALGILPELILSSPLPRAEQTARILVDILGKDIPLQISNHLAPGGRKSDLYGQIRSHSSLASLMLVGHQPALGEIAGEIAWGSPENYIELKKGGACALEMTDLVKTPRGTLLWLVTPAFLR